MKRHFFAKLLAALGIILSGVYLLLLVLSRFVALPVEISENFFFADWAFIIVPILGLVSAVALQIASVRE